jgi:hypothetical protein
MGGSRFGIPGLSMPPAARIPDHKGEQMYPMPQPPRRSNTTKIVLLIVGSARQTGATFLADLKNNDYDAAYALLCANVQDALTPDKFREGVQARGQIVDYDITGVQVFNRNGRTGATVTASLQYDRGFADTHIFPLVKEGGGWRVCGEPY